jgi:hypothetical protein
MGMSCPLTLPALLAAVSLWFIAVPKNASKAKIIVIAISPSFVCQVDK